MNGNFFAYAGFLQFEIVFGDPAANLAKIKTMLAGLAPEATTLVALPELWACGFDYGHAEELAGQTPDLLQELTMLASRWNIYFCGSLLERVDNDEREPVISNSLYFVGPEGVLGCYRTQPLFALWQEDRHFSPGGLFHPVRSPSGAIGGLVCYDLRFPELGRQQAFYGAQLLVVSAEWPGSRIDHWQSLVRARAIENQVFVVACNSCGKTGEHELGGNSMVVGPDGAILLQAGSGEEAVVTGLAANELPALRSRFCPAGERPRPVQDNEKHVGLPLLLDSLGAIRKQRSRIVFTNGCFDILHSGHVAYLERARSTGDCLVVGLNSDRSVRAIKGPDRPVNSEQDRARILSALACVDYVVIFDEETPCNLITAILPDILVNGADWAEADIVGAAEVKAAGGKVVRVAFEHDVSTSGLISRIQTKE
jgi:rfaE bifunctional protein nucleotidyltransferase chain/domain